MSAQFTADYFNQNFLKPVTEVSFIESMEGLRDLQYQNTFHVITGNEVQKNFISTEAVGGAEVVPEGGVIPKSKTGKGYRTTFLPEKVALQMELTKEMFYNGLDDTQAAAEIIDRKRTSILNDVATKMQRKLYSVFNETFKASPAILAPDGEPLIATNHKYNSSAVEFNNDLGAVAFGTSVMDDIFERMGDLRDSEDKIIGLSPKIFVCKKGGAASRQIKKTLGTNNSQYSPTNLANVNIYQGLEDDMTMIETSFIEDGNNYFVMPDYSMLGFDNPLLAGIIDAPGVDGEFSYNYNTSSMVLNFMTYFSYGIKDLPVGIFGGQGSS